MSDNKNIVFDYKITGKKPNSHHAIFCPGCKQSHIVDEGWTFNGDYLKPTFTPSILVNGRQPVERVTARGAHRCHSFVTDGKIQFLGDCTHELKNTTVDLKPFDEMGV